jgi:hypothetical protein
MGFSLANQLRKETFEITCPHEAARGKKEYQTYNPCVFIAANVCSILFSLKYLENICF